MSKIHESGEILTDLKKSVVVMITKETGVEKLYQYRTILLTSRASKIFVHIIYRRIKRTVVEKLGEEQFYLFIFWIEQRMKEAILTLRIIIRGRLCKKNQHS